MVKINNPLPIESRIDEFIKKNSFKLFHTIENDNLTALFDKRGFWFDKITKIEYQKIMSKPHIYIAFSDNKNGYIYVGISNQTRGRWQRGHSYHLGTLAHTILRTKNSYDQNHDQWVSCWMKLETININEKIHSITLKNQIYISFIPFEFYMNDIIVNDCFTHKEINLEIEKRLIQFYKKRGFNLLNIKHSNL